MQTQRPFLHINERTFLYGQFASAAEAVKDRLESSGNRKVAVLSSRPELYYLAFYLCFTHDYVYCPINIDDPLGTIEAKISIIDPGVILTNDNFFFSNYKTNCGAFEPVAAEPFGACYLCFRENAKAEDDAMQDVQYILFTSGTTGDPKGVPITRQNVAGFTANMKDIISIDESDVIANTFKFSFDLSIFSMILAWNAGAAISHISGDEILSGARNHTYSKITVVSMLPSVFRIFRKNNTFSQLQADKVKYFLFCGEPLYTSDIDFLKKKFSLSVVYNLYGPTELTIYCSFFRASDEPRSYNDIISIGKMNSGCKAFIADAEVLENNRITGELCVSGTQNFKGYLNSPGRDRFFEMDGQLYYRTGDRVVYDRGEDLYYYAARVDREVKYYGHRINLSNVENLFNGLEEIKDSAAVYSRKHMTLGLFIMSDGPFKPEENGHLFRNIPSYLRPTHFFPAPSFPVNANFKKDYKTLELFYDFYLERKHADSKC